MIAGAVVLEHGRDELLRRLAHPYWFQCFSWFQRFGAVMGMHWHSPGIPRACLGPKRPRNALGEVGLQVCGGRGGHELMAAGDQTGLDAAALARASR